MKHLLTTMTVLLFVNSYSASATDINAARQNFAGFNASVGAAYNLTTFQVGYEIDQNNPLDVSGSGSAANTKNQAQTYAALGYGYLAHTRYYLGINGFVNFGSVTSSTVPMAYAYDPNATSSMFVGTFSSKLQNFFGLEFQPGYAVTDNDLFYTNVGVIGATVVNTFTSASTDQPTVLSSNSNTTQIGFVLGLGYKRSVTSLLGIFFELNYMQIGQFNQTVSLPGATGYSNTFTQNPYVAQAVLGVSF